MDEPADGDDSRPTCAKRLNIAIASLGRFHVLDLARELSALGHRVRFYSYVPLRRARRFGLPQECHVALLPYLFPIVALQRVLPRRIGGLLDRWIYRAANIVTSLRMEPCDVFIGMSGVYLEAAQVAREKYGARLYLERGSRHILSQRDILAAIPGAEYPPDFAIRRELKGYELADRIAVPSRHVERSFIERGIAQSKLFRNPYGVDLDMFRATEVPRATTPTLIYVGAWSLRKGVDVLTKALRLLPQVRLLHVGSILEAEFPEDAQFIHQSAVPQWQLREFYGKAHVFVLASREEGLSLVQVQALACGLPVVCTDRTGGEDLRTFMRDPALMAVVPSDNVGALANSMEAMLTRAMKMSGTRDVLLPAGREMLTWRAYGARYSRELTETALNIRSDKREANPTEGDQGVT